MKRSLRFLHTLTTNTTLNYSTSQNSLAKKVIPEYPVKPDRPCCNSGCGPDCVVYLYAEQKNLYRRKLKSYVEDSGLSDEEAKQLNSKLRSEALGIKSEKKTIVDSL